MKKHLPNVLILIFLIQLSFGLIAFPNQAMAAGNTYLGVNVSGPEFAPWNGQSFPNSADFSYLANKGITFVRLPIAWESLQPTLSAALDTTYLGKIQTAIATAHSNGIGVIVDLHNFGSYCSQSHWTSSLGNCGYAGNAGNTGTGVNFLGDGTLTQSAFTDLWTRLSTALVGTPGLIGYDLMNEPSTNILQYGTNLLFAPNGFADNIGTHPWFTTNSATLTQQANGSNPLGASYGPSWIVTSGTGFGAVIQAYTTANVPYDFSIYAKVSSGTQACNIKIGGSITKSITVTTSWQRFDVTGTPTAASQQITFAVSTASAGVQVQIANAQLELGSSPTTYAPNPFLSYAQAAITAIRAVDSSTSIYINGLNGGAYQWPWVNWEMGQLTGGNLVFEGHQYFDGSIAQGGGGGTYSGNYSSYSITSSAGVSEVTPFENWLTTTGLSGYIGEYAVPDNSKSDQASWLTLQNLFLQNLLTNNIPSAMWFYGAPGLQLSNILNISPSSTANGGSDDPRLTQMLQQISPVLITLSPANNATNIALASNLVLTFNENIAKGTGNILIKKTSDDTTIQTIDVSNAAVSISNNTVTIDPPSDLDYGTGYYVTMASGVFTDTASPTPTAYAGISDKTVFNFTTVAAPVTPPVTDCGICNTTGGFTSGRGGHGTTPASPIPAIPLAITGLPSVLLTNPSPLTLSHNYQLWDTGSEVQALQIYLNTHGYPIASTGAGSPGHETFTFGTLTYKALVQYQLAHNLPGTGYLGPLTRGVLSLH